MSAFVVSHNPWAQSFFSIVTTPFRGEEGFDDGSLMVRKLDTIRI
jgi:hypothetical protein